MQGKICVCIPNTCVAAQTDIKNVIAYHEEIRLHLRNSLILSFLIWIMTLGYLYVHQHKHSSAQWMALVPRHQVFILTAYTNLYGRSMCGLKLRPAFCCFMRVN